jgi:hypothetical protein
MRGRLLHVKPEIQTAAYRLRKEACSRFLLLCVCAEEEEEEEEEEEDQTASVAKR